MHKNDRIIVLLGIVIIVIALVGAAVGGKPKSEETGSDEKFNDYRSWPIKESSAKHTSGSSQENSDETLVFNITDNYVTQLIIELNWLDETSDSRNYENQPDSFNFTVFTAWDEVISSDDVFNPVGEAGLITETITIPEEGIKDAAIGEWTISIHCGNCGDQVPIVSLLGLREIEDTGNDWILNYHYEFHSNN